MGSDETSTESNLSSQALPSGDVSRSRTERLVVILHKTIVIGTGLALLPWTMKHYDAGDWKPLAANAIALTTIATGKSLVDVLKAVVKPR